MRPVASLFAAACLLIFGSAAWWIGLSTAKRIEATTFAQTSAALSAAGQDWVGLGVDGLIVRLTGQAPDKTQYQRTLEILTRLIGAKRIDNYASIAVQTAITPAPLRLEILRSGGDLTLLGMVPQKPGPEPLTLAASNIPGITGLTDLLETTALTPPDGWPETLSFAIRSLDKFTQGSVILEPGAVTITAITGSDQLKQSLIATLTADAPQNIALTLNITAPPPLISPFIFAFELANPPSLQSCTASSPEENDLILRAARSAGDDNPTKCAIGLGSPTPLWPRTIELALATLEQMPGGTLLIEDTDIRLTAPASLDPATFEALAQDLRAALPPIFSLTAIAPQPSAPAAGKPQTPARFIAELSADGTLSLAGPVRDARSNQAIQTYAASLFGFGRISGTLTQTPDLPEGWPGKILSGLETLSLLSTGRLEITEDGTSITGTGASETIAEEVRDALAARPGGAGNTIANVRFDPALVPPEVPGLKPEQCDIRISTLLAEQQIFFAPNSIEIEPDSIPLIDAIANILRQCKSARFEIGGHTDSQGREALNIGLSRSRADAVLDALLSREVLIAELVARGYGESEPVADNETEEGRRKNRRIAFKLLEDAGEQD